MIIPFLLAATIVTAPVILNGKDGSVAASALTARGDSMTVTATQPSAPAKFFLASGNSACAGMISIVGGGPPGAPEYAKYTTSTGDFTITLLGDESPHGCTVTIGSNVGGAPATINFL